MEAERAVFSEETRIETIELELNGIAQPITYADRAGEEPALLCLHGLGSTKEDYASLTRCAGLAGYRILAWDAPGSGASPYRQSLTIEDLRDLILALRDALQLGRPFLVGHSMGGLTGLLAAREKPDAFRGFVNLEGNLTPEDCGVFSRTAAAMDFARFEGRFFPWLELEFARSSFAGYPAFSRRFPDNVEQEAFWDYCRSIVKISDLEPLLSDFCALPIPCMYLHGSENRTLQAATMLRGSTVAVEEVPFSNHFPLDTNPEFILNVLERFCRRAVRKKGLTHGSLVKP